MYSSRNKSFPSREPGNNVIVCVKEMCYVCYKI